jgi:hypothetical protein
VENQFAAYGLAQQAHIVLLNRMMIFMQLDGNTIGAGQLGDDGGGYRVWAPGVHNPAHAGHVVYNNR